MRCDLHAHSIRSGASDLPLLRHFGNECYSEPRAVYEQARRRGMELVTLTDHDTIEGALELAALPGTFVSEEVTCELPAGRKLHLGVFDIGQRQHERIARLRRDAEALFAFLAEERIPACVNHAFSALTGARQTQDIHAALSGVSLLEARNGMMSMGSNACAEAAGRWAGLGLVGGSDAHTLASLARAYTVVPGATTREEFLAGLRRGLTLPAGRSGSYAQLAADVARVVSGAYRSASAGALDGGVEAFRFGLMLLALPLLPLIPVATAATYGHEQLFARRHARLFETSTPRLVRPATRASRPLGPAGPFGPAAATSPPL